MQAPTSRVNTPETAGLAFLSRVAGDPERLQSVWEALVARTADPADAGAYLDVATLLLATGNREKGLEVQAAAVADQRCYRRPAPGETPELRVLAFMTKGDFTANTPLDFLLEGANVELISCYLDGPPDPADVPEHDVAFLAIGQSEESAELLAEVQAALAGWPRPVLNNRPDLISSLTRDGVAARFLNHPHVLCPQVVRVQHAILGAIAAGTSPISALAPGLAFPIIARPVGTHAGHGMEKLEDAAHLSAFLDAYGEAEFYVTAFTDYSGPDGLFRKLRIVFIGGRPFISHMAVSDHWMVHYLNAYMDQSVAKREEEAQLMASFNDDFAVRHAEAFRALGQAFPLDYFGIDCAETADGRLLVFETDVAMIVHAMDPEDLFPYKKPAMAKLFAAFVAMLKAASAGVAAAA